MVTLLINTQRQWRSGKDKSVLDVWSSLLCHWQINVVLQTSELLILGCYRVAYALTRMPKGQLSF